MRMSCISKENIWIVLIQVLFYIQLTHSDPFVASSQFDKPLTKSRTKEANMDIIIMAETTTPDPITLTTIPTLPPFRSRMTQKETQDSPYAWSDLFKSLVAHYIKADQRENNKNASTDVIDSTTEKEPFNNVFPDPDPEAEVEKLEMINRNDRSALKKGRSMEHHQEDQEAAVDSSAAVDAEKSVSEHDTTESAEPVPPEFSDTNEESGSHAHVEPHTNNADESNNGLEAEHPVNSDVVSDSNPHPDSHPKLEDVVVESVTSSADLHGSHHGKEDSDAGRIDSQVAEEITDNEVEEDIEEASEGDHVIHLHKISIPKPSMEISHKIARKLCRELLALYPKRGRTGRSYLWAPILQYAPAIDRGFPLATPEFTPDCMTWKERICNGTARYPLLKPCTYWAPMPLKSVDCFNAEAAENNEKVIYVNYRPPEYNATICPCRWPCVPRFDRIQHCRVTVSTGSDTGAQDEEMDLGSDLKEGQIKIPQYKAMQLCRGMRDWVDQKTPIKIDSIPIRIKSLSPQPDKIKDCVTWKYIPCKSKDHIGHNSHGAKTTETGSNKGHEDQMRKKRQEGGDHEIHAGKKEEPESDSEENWVMIQPKEDGSGSDGSGGHKHQCGIWEKSESSEDGCVSETPAEKKDGTTHDHIDSKSFLCKGKWPCYLSHANKSKEHEHLRRKRGEDESDSEEAWVPIQPREGKGEKSGDTGNDNNGDSSPESDSDNALTGDHFSKGPGCNCDWPCLPFFDPINKCYNEEGDLLVDANGKHIILPRRFTRTQKQLILCLSHLENYEIDCFIKK